VRSRAESETLLNLAINCSFVACRKGLNLSIPAESLDLFFRLFEKCAEKAVFFDDKVTGRLMFGGCCE
jgi:hypothetical protein